MFDETHQVRTRRAFLAAGFGAAIATLAGAVGRPNPARAANGDPILIARSNSGTGRTDIANNNAHGQGAIYAYCPTGVSVLGDTLSGTGLHGASDSGVGVHGTSNESYGVYGESPDSYAVTGLSSTSGGVAGFSDTGQGVIGVSNTVGVLGQSGSGRGGRFSGGKAQIKLDPSTSPTHPGSGAAGDIFLDSSKRLWLCTKGGNPATWRQLSFV